MPRPVPTQCTLFVGKKLNGQRPNTSRPIQRSKETIKPRLGRVSVDMYSRENIGKTHSAAIRHSPFAHRTPPLCAATAAPHLVVGAEFCLRAVQKRGSVNRPDYQRRRLREGSDGSTS